MGGYNPFAYQMGMQYQQNQMNPFYMGYPYDLDLAQQYMASNTPIVFAQVDDQNYPVIYPSQGAFLQQQNLF